MKSIGLVTASYNSELTIGDTIESVRQQLSSINEFIVVDGGSNDRTLSIIKQNCDVVDYWVSEKDRGISDAFNKGIELCSSDFVLLLNSDDVLMPGSLELIKGQLLDLDTIYCPLHCVGRDREEHFYKSDIENMPKYCSVFHPGAIIPKKIYEQVGMYDVRMRVAMDYDFFCRCLKSGVRFQNLDHPLVKFRVGGESSKVTFDNLREVFLIRKKYFDAKLPTYEARKYLFHLGGEALRFFGMERTLRVVRSAVLRSLFRR